MNGYNNFTAPSYLQAGTAGQYYQNLAQPPIGNATAASTSSLMTVLVSSEEEVNNYPVAAGMTVMLMDFGHKRFWLKSTAMNGVPQQPRVFSMEEITPSPSKIQNEPTGVTREEFNLLTDKLDKLIASLGGTD